jgi:DNA repair photolyase
MKAIYEPKGKAKEYCDLAVNLYRGCGHGCSYCYAPAVLRMQREEFTDHPAVRPGILEAIEKEAPKYKGREVQLCFTCDPYQMIDKELQITRRAIEILKANDITVRILTKGGLYSERDFDLLEPQRDWYGVTMTFYEPAECYKWEPHTATPLGRILSLKRAKKEGLRTWVSLEPVINPCETLTIICKTHKYVDVFKLGKWNHDARAKEIDWRVFVRQAIDLFNILGQDYYIKEDLRRYLD